MMRNVTIVALLLLLLPMAARAQGSAKITGTVTDAQTGEPLPGATVALEGTTMGAATNADGEYTIFQVPAGTYTVEASFVGYTTVRRSGVDIIGGITRRLDFELPTSEVQLDVVEVTAQRELVNPTATNAVRRLGREEIENLPTRDVETFYAIQPGVTALNDEIYIRGGRPDETEFLLEGTTSRSLLGTDNVIPVIPEALEEVQVHAGGYSAEYGGANAGIIQQTLRTGGSELSGLVQYETDQASDPFTDHVTDYQDLTITLGGPLVTNKLRFFGAFNYVNTDNYDPTYWYGAELGQPIDQTTGDVAPDTIGWNDGELPGLARPREQFTGNGTLQLNLHPLRVRLAFAQTTREQRTNTLPIYSYFNQERIPQREDLRRLINLEGTYFVADKTYIEASVGRFNYTYDVYDPLFDMPDGDGEGGALIDLLDYYTRSAVGEALGGDTELAKLYTQYWDNEYQDPVSFNFNTFRFDRPGQVTTSYQHREQSYWNTQIGVVSQIENHELRVGGQYQQWEVRNYVGSAGPLASRVQNDSTFLDLIEQESPEVAQIMQRAGYGAYGYDVFMNEVDDGPDGPKRPVTAALYVNDKMEFDDIVVNAGLRWDYFDMDLWTTADKAAPEYDPNTGDVTGLEQADATSYLQPRLGISFPATDRTVFHLQYGKFAQMPDMSYVYEDRASLATSFGGQNFISNPFAWDLEPIKSTQYEIGFANQFTDFSSFDITAFYRKTEGQLEIQLQEVDPTATAAANYNVYANGDFSIARGLEFTLQMRRIGGFLGMVNYTLTDAKGTNSEPGGQVAALENQTTVPSLIQPLTFESRHRGTVMLDYRTDTNNTLTENLGINVLFLFNSGHRFTRSTGGIGQRGADEGALLADTDPRNRVPLEPLNTSTTPWNFVTNLQIEKGFSFGPATATAYLTVENLFDTRNVLNVYLRSGDAESDAFLTSPELSDQIVAAQGEGYVTYYEAINLLNRQHYIDDEGDDLFGEPRQVRLGVKVGF